MFADVGIEMHLIDNLRHILVRGGDFRQRPQMLKSPDQSFHADDRSKSFIRAEERILPGCRPVMYRSRRGSDRAPDQRVDNGIASDKKMRLTSGMLLPQQILP